MKSSGLPSFWVSFSRSQIDLLPNIIRRDVHETDSDEVDAARQIGFQGLPTGIGHFDAFLGLGKSVTFIMLAVCFAAAVSMSFSTILSCDI